MEGSRSGATASPAGVISPIFTRRRQRIRFLSHQLLRLRRGVKCWTGFPYPPKAESNLHGINVPHHSRAVCRGPVHPQPEITDFVVILLIPPVQILSSVYVKQVGYVHYSVILRGGYWIYFVMRRTMRPWRDSTWYSPTEASMCSPPTPLSSVRKT